MRRTALMAVVFVGIIGFAGGLFAPRANAQDPVGAVLPNYAWFDDALWSETSLSGIFALDVVAANSRPSREEDLSVYYESHERAPHPGSSSQKNTPGNTPVPPTSTELDPLYKITLESVGTDKDRVISAICEVTGASVEESASMVMNVPSVIAEHASQADASKIRQALVVAGARMRQVRE